MDWLKDKGLEEMKNHPELMVRLKCCGFTGQEDFLNDISWKHCVDRIDNYGIITDSKPKSVS